MQGKFISFEGNDGSGKTTISTYIHEQLQQQGYDVIYTREPGGIGISEKIRDIILDPAHTNMDARTEALLYAASRRQHLVEKILPALAEGKIVLCDRFVGSSLAYQGYARNIGMQTVYDMNSFAIEGHFPDATVFLKVPLEVGLERIHGRGKKDRLDNESKEFHQRVSDGYEIFLRDYQADAIIVDASKDMETVKKETLEVVLGVLSD